jgi:ADP-ribose pyrophosphatase
MIKPWKILSSKVSADYKIFRIRVDEAVSPRTHASGAFYTLQSNHWVNVIPLTHDREVVMIRQYRHGSRRVTLEIPGGIVDEADPKEAAIRELFEETGYRGQKVSLLGSTNPNPAIFDNQCYTYLVEDAAKAGDAALEADEDIEVELVPLSSIPALIRDGTIDHALVIVAFHFFFQHNGCPEGPCSGS